MATDLAQRSVEIKLGQAKYTGEWNSETDEFIDKYRWEIIGDIIAALRAEPFPLAKHSRWAPWEAAVLCRLPEPNEAQAVILERQAELNVELDEVGIIEEYFASELERLGYDPDVAVVRIPNAVAADWYKKAIGDHKILVPAIGRKLAQMIGESKVKLRLSKDRSRKHGRGLIWTGDNFDPFGATANDLLDRIEEKRESRSGGRDWR